MRFRGERYAPVYAVPVKVADGIDGVGESLVFADFLEQTAGHAGAHRYVKDREGATVLVVHEAAVKAESPEKVRLRDVAFLDDFDALVRRVDVVRRYAAKLFLFEFFCTKFYKLLMVDFARSANVERNFVGNLVPVLEHLLARQGLDLLDVSGNGMRNAAALEMDGVKDVAGKFFGNVVVAVDFFDDDAALLFHFFLVESRVHEHVRDDVDGKRHVATFDLRVETGFLTGGVGFETSTAVFDGMCDFEGCAVFGAFEYQVFVKVAEPEFVGGFVTAASRNPNSHRRRIGVWHVVG